MQVPTTSSATASTQSSAGAASKPNSASATTVNYDQFLKLLIAEMQNQDPTKPMDPTQTVSQLASFSAVEQAVQTNSTLTSMLNLSALSQASSMVGKTVTSADGATSGVVKSVTTSSSGSTATLVNGATIPLTAGISIS
jgi:flagellar basal-body rod modification protein FlgD